MSSWRNEPFVDSALLLGKSANVLLQIRDLVFRQLGAVLRHFVLALGDRGEEVGVGLLLNIGRGQVADLQVLAHRRIAGGVLAMAHGALGFKGGGAFVSRECGWNQAGKNERKSEDRDEK